MFWHTFRFQQKPASTWSPNCTQGNLVPRLMYVKIVWGEKIYSFSQWHLFFAFYTYCSCTYSRLFLMIRPTLWVAYSPCHFPMNWGFFKTVDRIRCDKELLDKAQGFADAGNISEEQALDHWSSVAFSSKLHVFPNFGVFQANKTTYGRDKECVIPVWLTEQLSTVKLTSLDIITHHWTYALPSNVVAVFMFSFVELLKRGPDT